MRKQVVLFVIALAVVGAGALAGVPPMVNYQGKLMQPSGAAVPDGTYSMQFTIYDAPVGGNVKWQETNTSVQVKGGLFAVLLGSVTNLPANIFDNPDRWFGVKVGADPEMTPRQKVASSAFAFRAAVAGTVDDGAITTGKIADGAVTGEKIAAGAVSAAKMETQQGWIAAELSNGWANSDPAEVVDYRAAYMRDSLGFVHIRGTIRSGQNGFVFALPAGYRPKVAYQRFVVPCYEGVAHLDAKGDGSVCVLIITGTNAFVHITVSFKAEQ